MKNFNTKTIFKLKKLICALLTFIFIAETFTSVAEAKKNDKEEQKFTGHWQFVNALEDIPSCGNVLISYAKDTTKIFYGSLSASGNKNVKPALEKKELQLDDNTGNAFMLVQDAQSFYIRLANNNYLKISGDLTSAYLEETPDIEEATAFNIELIGYGISNYSYYRIYMPYGLSDLSLVVSEGQITLSSACYSGFYLMAESTKAKEPPFGKFTGLIRFLATVVTVALVLIMLHLYKKDILNIIYFGISTICVIALLVFFMIFAITSDRPGLYVLHKSTFNTTALTNEDTRGQHNSYFEIIEDGSAIFSFEGESEGSYIWGCSIQDDNVFTTSSSGNYTNGLYTIWLRPFSSGTYDVVFYYYDVTKDISTTKECKTYHIEVNENNQITLIEPHMGEV